jgi:hypothetical protein
MKSNLSLFGKMTLAAIVGAVASWGAGCAQADDPEREEVGEQQEAIGDKPCTAFINGQPNPNWPACKSHDGPTIPGPSCGGYSTCYCFCRANNRCDLNPSLCNALTQCLNNCDSQYPGCPYPGGGFPSSPAACL